MHRIWYARDGLEASEIVEALAEEGIVAEVLGMGLQSAGGALPTNTVGPEICIADESRREDALQIIRALIARGGLPPYFPTICTQCGYDLRGSPDPRCPECGFEFRAVPPPWTCACGEEVEGHFGVCWRCGAMKPESEAADRSRPRAEAPLRYERLTTSRRDYGMWPFVAIALLALLLLIAMVFR
ncbi:MAG: hypothetical protein SF069_12100 [Phycisphaerae bacterium]|nr:hypothetical protein [Phycisphaerae bacterium]